MLLSEAILLGSLNTKQGFLPPNAGSKKGYACALEAAVMALGLCKTKAWDIVDIWPWVANVEKDSLGRTFVTQIWVLNDKKRLSRPQIAQWVAEKEKELGITDTMVPMVIEQKKEGEYALSR
ncbi:MAG: hypothetical protein ACRCYP_04670 [Alphaproteobacteria bacterium]